MLVLLRKDLRILRRSPGLLVVLALYALVIGVPVGYAVSRPPAKPKVAFVNEVAPDESTLTVGGRQIDASKYADRLFESIDPIRVSSRAAAIEQVRSGRALAALIVPAGVTDALQGTLGLGGGAAPRLEVYYSADDALKRRFVQDTITAQVAKANQALGRELTTTASSYIDILLRGGDFSLLGIKLQVLGLQRSAQILQGVEGTLGARDPQRAEIERVRRFAQTAIDNLDLSKPLLRSVAEPIRVDVRTVGGSTGSLDGFAVAAALAVALLLLGLLVGAGMLALEREEHAFGRLVRGLVSRTALVAEKVLLGAICAGVTALALLGLLALFEPVALGRVGSWGAALVAGAMACAALGVAVGAVTRDVRAASLLGVLLALPIAALALVPVGTLDGPADAVASALSAVFPFRATLQALDAGLNATQDPSLGAALLHLVLLVVGWTALARVAVRRFERP